MLRSLLAARSSLKLAPRSYDDEVTVMAYSPMTLAELAVHLGSTEDHERRWRLVLEFLEEFSHEDSSFDDEIGSSNQATVLRNAVSESGILETEPTRAKRSELLAEEPESCGDLRWDILVAAVAEHLSWIDRTEAPSWCTKPELMWFGKVWFVDPMPSAQAWALAHSPAPFRRRGIFLHPDDLTRA